MLTSKLQFHYSLLFFPSNLNSSTFLLFSFNSNEEKTDGIASPTTCRIDIDKIDNWEKVVSDSGYNLSQIIAKKTTDELKKIVPSLSTESPPETPDLVVDEPKNDNDENDPMPKDVTRLVKTNMKWSEDESLEEKTKLLFSIWDFAGHHLYYTMHQVFLSPRSIYCVVFDASKDLNSLADMDFMPVNLYQGIHQEFPTDHEMTNLEFLDFWLNSIFTHVSENPQKDGVDCPLSPPVFIVGTHLDQISGTKEEKKEKLDKIKSTIKSYLKDKPYVKHVVPEIYFVDNTLRPLGENMTKFKEDVEEIMRKQPYMNESIPISWFRFEHLVMELRKSDINYISLQQARDEAKQLGIQDEKELFDMLHLLHNVGIIAFYGDYDRNNDALADMVVLNPQWLLDIFTKVITITKREEKWTEFKCCWRILEEKGILEEVLIHHVWKDFPEECRESLLQIMERFDLLCENKVQRDESDALGTGDNQYQRQFFVPCQLIPNEGDKGRVWESEPNAVVININSKNGFLPEGLFHRLSVKAASWTQQKDGYQSKPPRFYYRQTELYLDEDHELILKMHVTKNGKRMIKVVIYFPPLEDDDSSIPTASMCKEVLVFIENSLNDLRTMWMKNITLDLCIPCYMCMNYDDHHHNLSHCLEKGKIGCNKSRCKTTFWQNLFSSTDATWDVCHPLKCLKNTELNPSVTATHLTPSSTLPVVPETNNDNVNEPYQSVLISEITPSDLETASNGLPPAKTRVNGTTVSVTGDNNTLIMDSQVNLCIWRQRCPLRTHAPAVVVAICAIVIAIYLLVVGCCHYVNNV
ncbi:cyclic GMP-binding protein C-like [Antedon mediterranea]|uniref:cyclic GMP-binding protein C-like n=1 Tax=Antedon mediterranea TaxID=105859 RepID=UPI003AF9D874